MNKKCIGCGIELQYNDKNKIGYIPENKYNDSNYCMRCFRLIHYNDITTKDKELSTNYILDKVNKDNIFKIYVIDFLNINNNTIDIYNKIKGNKLLLINKIDMLNKSINKKNITNNIKTIYNIDNVLCISTLNDNYINMLLNYLNKNNINKCYILGPTNSGKSTLINKLCNNNNLTISNKRNTTLEFINIKLDNINIIDTPGFLISDYNLKTKYNHIIKPITYNMKDNDIIFIDKFYIKFKYKTSITIYCYEKIDSKKYYKDIKFDYSIDTNNNIDLCINGFGIINIKNKNNIEIYNLDKELISIRESVFGGNNE